MKEIVDKANEYVRDLEFKHARSLVRDVQEAKRHAVVCGCPNCKKSVEGAKNALTKEATRIYPDEEPIDHEEEFIRRHGSRLNYEL